MRSPSSRSSCRRSRSSAATGGRRSRARRTGCKGSFRIGGQEQFYLEGQVAYAVPKEDGDMLVYSSTQHPGEVQLEVAPRARRRRASGTWSSAAAWAAASGARRRRRGCRPRAAAVMARRTGRPVKLRYDRDDDITITGKRHDYLVEYEVGFDGAGRILGARSHVRLALRVLRRPERAGQRPHGDARGQLLLARRTSAIVSHRCKTHTQSNTAFRGFGGPQGMLGSEHVVDEIARHPRPGSARSAPGQLLRTRPRRHALRHAGRGLRRRPPVRRAGAFVGVRGRGATRSARGTRRAPSSSAGSR